MMTSASTLINLGWIPLGPKDLMHASGAGRQKAWAHPAAWGWDGHVFPRQLCLCSCIGSYGWRGHRGAEDMAFCWMWVIAAIWSGRLIVPSLHTLLQKNSTTSTKKLLTFSPSLSSLLPVKYKEEAPLLSWSPSTFLSWHQTKAIP